MPLILTLFSNYGRLIVGAIIICSCLACLSASSQTLQSGSGPDYPPLAIVNPDGEADGYSVDMLREAAYEEGYNIDFEVAPCHTLKEKLEAGELDVLPLVAYSEARAEKMIFSTPYLITYGSVFTRIDEAHRFAGVEDLAGKQVVFMRGGTAEDFLETLDFEIQPIRTDSLNQAMHLLATGEADCVVAVSLAGLRLLHEKGLDDQIVRAVKRISQMETRWCFAAPKGSELLINQLNEGLLLMRADGTYDRLYEKWLLPYMAPKSEDMSQFWYCMLALALFSVLTWLVFYCWVRSLRHSVLSRTKELKAARDEAQAANQAKSDFLAIMSHELRTPLNPILVGSDLLLAEATGENKKLLKIIHEAGEHMLSVVEEVLTFSRLESGSEQAKDEDVLLRDLFKSVAGMLSKMAERKELDLQVDIQVPNQPVICCGKVIRQIAFNLLSNALKFTETGFVRLEVSYLTTEGTEDLLKIIVTDSGVGIPGDKKEIIFNPFVQVDNSYTRQHSGTGLGLAITRDQVKLLGGRLSMESEVGEGSRFEVSIPIAKKQRVSSKQEIGAEQTPEPHSPTKKLNIMVVENEAANRVVIEKMLDSLGHNCALFPRAQGALDALDKGELFDLVLMDIKMPEMDGITATRKIRERFSAECLPIVGATADVMPSTRADCEQAGMSAFLEKPIRMAAMKRVLQENAPSSDHAK